MKGWRCMAERYIPEDISPVIVHNKDGSVKLIYAPYTNKCYWVNSEKEHGEEKWGEQK